ncbi:uncharacterized protein [Hetaerina americana]|uniref:uncharacterized protein isoform X2 n=1 Tax=Hetaerina americana TaxID=62018 RepID=UPI003A7F5732
MKYRVGGGGAVGGLVRFGEAVSRAPPELREWLDAKLEQVGVDPSPAYSRYVLGLLLQPEGEGGEEEGGVDEDEDPKAGPEGRRRRRQGRRQGIAETPIGYSWPGECPTSQKEAKVIGSDFGKSRKRSRASSGRYHGVFGDGEFRKRTAAIDCLMSASDQKSGIEKLVDELCVKLKQIQNEAVDGGNFHFELTQVSENPNGNATKCSAQDQAEKYYAAFPPLKKLEDRSTNSSMTMSFDNTCAWNNRKVLSKCIGRNKKNEVWLSNDQMNETQDGENKENVKKKSYGRPFGENSVWGISGTGKEINSQIGLKDNLGGKFTSRHQRVPYFKARREQSRIGRDFNNENEEGGNCKTDPVRMVLMMALASSAKMWSGSSQRYSLGETDTEELDYGKQHVRRRLYELKRNGWEGEHMEEKFPIEGESDEESLASLFAKFDRRMEALWELEPESELPPSFSLLANMPSGHNTKAVSPKAPPNYSFILSGTNITSSIWSQCPISNYITNDSCNMNVDGKEVVPESYNGSRVVGSELKRLAIKTGLVTPQLENFRIIWEESTTLCPPQFIGVEKVVSADSESCVSTAAKEEEVQEQPPLIEGEGIMLSPLVCYHTVTKESLETLNHSREKSGFMEVTPRVSLKCDSCPDANQLDPKPQWPPAVTYPSNHPSKINLEEEDEVEEDLLTSARTHFLPIRRLSVDSSSGLSEPNSGGVHYEDGTTFSIQSTMEKVSFYRSESGNLILKEESDEGEDDSGKGICKTPKKYMIYKGAIGLKGRGFIADQDNSGFLPKFLVRQNEKSCQTDESDDQYIIGGGGGAGVANCYANLTSFEIGFEEEEQADVSKGEECEFFFPGDAHLADDLDSMDQGEVEEPKMISVVEWSQGLPCGRPVSDSKSEDKEEMSISLQDSWSKIPSVLCHCSSSVSVSTAAEMWEQKECNGHCWNKIWRSSPDGQNCSLQEMDVMPISQIMNGTAAAGELELQSKLLRQELSEESEQIFADLHMVRQMYLGMEWMGPDEEDAETDCGDEIEKRCLPCDEITTARKRNLSGWNKVTEKFPQVYLDENVIASQEKCKTKKIPYPSCLDYDLLEEIFGPLDPEASPFFRTRTTA